ncbi:MAG: hypothetical protein WEG56_01165 [Chloroflexota bacterium]
MTTEAHAADHGATTDHGTGTDHGTATDHGHGSDALGPIDVWAWGAGALGILLGLIVALSFALATAPVGG